MALVATVMLLSAAASPARASDPQTMTWALHFTLAPTLFEPAETPGLITPFMILYALHDAVAQPMPGKAMAPSLAESWTSSPAGLVHEFVLRKGVKQPWPDFLLFYGTPATGAGWVVPKKYVEKVGEDGFKRAPVGAGPYKFVSLTPGVELVLEALISTGARRRR